ncbi:hypothetical protein [Aureliella helgolandensis]|uniref:Inner membrane protein YjdF n=1 Tax=Aureliella helgolandensis TaxID=2527968 RepID=A0A518G381_9BACT|nr:hypothetical protein [Aureliella helgolandensis]QDV23067.1 hypothetical protein Q31a_13620 [Aureliella helgolandensis]
MNRRHEDSWFDVIHKFLVVFLRLLIAFGILLEVYEALWLNAAIAAGILLLTFLPTIFASRVQVEIPPEFEVLTVAFIFASLFLGETRQFYSKFWWWDIALHATSGVLLGVLGLLLVYVLNETPRVDLHLRPGFVAFFAFCFALSIGTVWEMFEFGMDHFFGMNMQKPMLNDPSGLTDTMIDLIVDALGAMLVSIAGYVYMKRGNESIIDRGIQRFIQRNPRLFSTKVNPR